MQTAHHPHVIDEYICEPLFEDLPFQNIHQHTFDTTWDLTPPDSPNRNTEDRNSFYDYSRITINLGPQDFSPCQDLASVMWNNGGGAFEVRGEWTAPPSPVAFEDLVDICSDLESYPSFELEEDPSLEGKASQIPFREPPPIVKRKAPSSSSAPPSKMLCKSKAPTAASKTAPARQRTGRRADSSPSPTTLEADDPESKRHTHNVLERKRRNELKSSYQELREEIPDLNENDKTPTGVILNRACEYIATLQEEEASLLAELALAKLENARLRKLYA